MSAETIAAILSLGWAAGALVVILVAGLSVPGIAKVFFAGQFVYWTLAFIGRPLVLLVADPAPKFGDPIADPRLATMGYAYSIPHVMHFVTIGLWIDAAFVVGYAIWRRTAGPPRYLERWRQNQNLLPTLTAMYLLGLGGRLASYATGSLTLAGEVSSANPYLDLIATLASLGAIGLIIYLRMTNTKLMALIIAGLFAVELIWGVITESKTPAISVALAIVIRFAMTGLSRRTVLAVVAGAIALLAGFGWLQSFKVSAADAAATSSVSTTYPASVRPFLSVIIRFDLFEASTDVYFMNGRPWISASQAVKNSLENFIPTQLGVTKFQSGTAWAQQVRGSSVDMSGVSVSLAEGQLNEGFLLAGYPGIVVESALFLGLVALAARLLHSRRTFNVVLGLVMVAVPVLFERGIMGVTETLGKGIQIAALAAILSLSIAVVRRRSVLPSLSNAVSKPHVQGRAGVATR